MAFIADQVVQGRRVESICRVLREQGCRVAARTYREWKPPSRPAADRTVTDAQVHNAVREAAWTTGPDGVHGILGMITPNEAEQAHYAALIPQEQPV